MNLACGLIILSTCSSVLSLLPSAKVKRQQYLSTPQPFYIRNNDQNAQTINQVDQKDANGNYNYAYETTNGIKVKQTSYMNGNDRVVVGYYSYIGPDNVPYTVNYIADKNGYRASGSHLPVQPGTSGLPPFPSLGGLSTPGPLIPVQPLQPNYIPTSTPSPLVISSSPYTPTQNPYSPTQTIYTPSTTIISTPASYPYTPTTPSPYYTPSTPFYPSSTPFYPSSTPFYPSSTPSPFYAPTTPSSYVPSSSLLPSTTPFPPTGYSSSLVNNNPPFPIYSQSTVPFPGYVYNPQPGIPYNVPSGPGYTYSTPVTRLSFATSPSSITRTTSTNTTPSPNLVLPSSTPSPFVRNYQPSYGLAINNNAPAIVASTPRPFTNTVTPLYNSDNNEVVYITPAPKLYTNQRIQPLSNIPNNLLLSRDFQPPYVSGNSIDAPSYYRNNNFYQSVRPLAASTAQGAQAITNLSFRNGNAY